MRTVLRWQVKPGQEETFVKVWTQATKVVRERVRGARGGMLPRSRRDAAEFVAASRWDSFDEWLAFM